jgi:hypothetical protein
MHWELLPLLSVRTGSHKILCALKLPKRINGDLTVKLDSSAEETGTASEK